MKVLYTSLLSVFALIFLFSACEEEGPYINFEPEVIDTSLLDTTYICASSVVPDPKNVLIEEFTGARCPNCPNAAAKLHDIQLANPGRVYGIAMHLNGIPFCIPHDIEKDYRTVDGTQIHSLLGGGASLPIGTVDRVHYSGETNLLVEYDVWNNYVDQRLALSSPVNIELNATPHKMDSNALVINVKLQFTTNVSDKQYLTVALLESNLVSPQTLPNSSIDSFFVNNHILRDVITNPAGDLLMDSPEKDRVFVKEFKLNMDDNYVVENCSVIVFVHQSGSDFDVHQVEEIHLN
jgi:hypothetical protein